MQIRLVLTWENRGLEERTPEQQWLLPECHVNARECRASNLGPGVTVGRESIMDPGLKKVDIFTKLRVIYESETLHYGLELPYLLEQTAVRA